jgi:thiamine pyrophosphate-dependent acetolactate synthase large subunit-like protein
VTDPTDLTAAISRALDNPGPALVEIVTDPQSR